jgi:hypothetical protein
MVFIVDPPCGLCHRCLAVFCVAQAARAIVLLSRPPDMVASPRMLLFPTKDDSP